MNSPSQLTHFPRSIIPARALAILCALALAAVLFGVTPVHGQTPVTLVSNTGQTMGASGIALGGTGTFARQALGFTTGTNEDGYTLGSIGFLFTSIPDTSTAGADLEATLLAATGTNTPGSVLCTLNDPGTFTSSGVQTFTAPTTGTVCPTLTKETLYFAAISRAAQTGAGDIEISALGSLGEVSPEDSGGAPGWSISDNNFPGSSTSWGFLTNTVFFIEVKGQTVALNRPAAGAPIISTGTPGDELWTATLTVGENLVGVGYSSIPGLVAGALSPSTFTSGGETHTVNGFLDNSVGALVLTLDTLLPQAFVLTAGNATFSSADATRSVLGGRDRYTWDINGKISWSENDMVPITLRGVGPPQVGTALRASVSGISDPEGVTNAVFTYQWVSVAGGVETDIPNAEAPAYYPTGDDVGKSFKVKVSFTDDEGGAEGPLTSAETAAVEATAKTVVWSGTLTVGTNQLILSAFGYDSDVFFDGDALDSPTFTVDSTTYTIEKVRRDLGGLTIGIAAPWTCKTSPASCSRWTAPMSFRSTTRLRIPILQAHQKPPGPPPSPGSPVRRWRWPSLTPTAPPRARP